MCTMVMPIYYLSWVWFESLQYGALLLYNIPARITLVGLLLLRRSLLPKKVGKLLSRLLGPVGDIGLKDAKGVLTWYVNQKYFTVPSWVVKNKKSFLLRNLAS